MEYARYDPTQRYPPNIILKMIPGGQSFPLLEHILDPTHTSQLLQDAVLVSIDLESRFIESLGMTQITQIGIASLDTRILASIDTDDPQSLVNAIQSRVFYIHPKRASRRAWAPKSLWAEPEKLAHEDICDKLNEILFCSKSNCSTTDKESRDVVLIGHGIRSDRSILREVIGFDLKSVSSIKMILDTGRMASNSYDFGVASHQCFPLRWTLRCLGIHYDHMHDAGNDAMFTIKALLLMFCNWKYQKGRHLWNIAEDIMFDTTASNTTTEVEKLLWECQLEVLTSIAREPWPVFRRLVPRRPVLSRRMKTETDLLLLAEDLDLTDMFS